MIVIFTSDNGGLHMPKGPHPRVTHNTPVRAGKGYLYEGGLRVALIVRGSGLANRRVIDAPLIDASKRVISPECGAASSVPAIARPYALQAA